MASNKLSQTKIIFIVLVGSILETYDYSLYGYFAPTLAQLFFPRTDPIASLLATFSVFAVGFMMRPIGAAIFGHFGDQYGRKKILMISILIMAIPTALIGLLPTYADIGIYAGILLVLCRLLQGLSVGAEFVGTMIYLIEQAPTNKKTLYGSLSICSGYLALLLTALIIALFTHFMPQTFLSTWGWRIPFLLGLLLGLIGFYIRANLSETNAFKTLIQEKTLIKHPFSYLIRTMPFRLLAGALVVAIHALGYYFLFVYMNSYLNLYYHLPNSTTAMINVMVIIFAIISIPIIGMLAERINKKYFIFLSTIGLIFFSYPLIKLLDQGTFTAILIAESLLTLLLSMTSAVLPTFLSELFPASTRYTGMALCYNISAVFFGGTAPLALTFLVEKTQNIAAPSYYLMFAAGITFCSAFLIDRMNLTCIFHPTQRN